MSYRVCILTAGIGSRLGAMTQYLNKSLVSIANRPILSLLIEQFPKDVEFVIALGHKGHLVREFLTLAYSQRKFFFAEVATFEGHESGLGLSLLACKQHLQQPFVFLSCDTLVREPIPAPDHNWMGYADGKNLQQYRTLKLVNKMVTTIYEKGEGEIGTHQPYIGLAGIFEYRDFWLAMEQGKMQAVKVGEVFGLNSLLNKKLTGHRFTWHDTGNPESLALARLTYQDANAPNILEKANEAIWFVDESVIKFSDDEKFIANRIKRSHELCGFIPEVTGSGRNMYRYSAVKGKVLSEVITKPLFERLLMYCKTFWQPRILDAAASKNFYDNCLRFYRDKTLERVELFYKNFKLQDGDEAINGIEMPRLETLLNSLDWHWIAEGIPSRFHGDFHFENIIWTAENQHFTFLDWRQDFGGDLVTGDVYYDLAKLLHGLIINHELISKDFFKVEWKENEIDYDFHRKQKLVECEKYFDRWLESEGYDRKKVWILTGMIYLNIAALHHYPYSLLLFTLGKIILFKELEK